MNKMQKSRLTAARMTSLLNVFPKGAEQSRAKNEPRIPRHFILAIKA